MYCQAERIVKRIFVTLNTIPFLAFLLQKVEINLDDNEEIICNAFVFTFYFLA